MAEQLEQVNCNLCGSSRTRGFLRLEDFSYRQCTGCGLVYQNPRPVFDHLRERYGEGYFHYEHSNQENFFHLMKLGLKDIGFDELFSGRGPGLGFLDIGCATGMLLNHMRQKGWRSVGVEVCAESARYGIEKFGLDIRIGTLEQAGFPDRSFEAIHFSHLIEHVPDPRALLVEVRRILKPDGHMIVTTPNVTGMHARFAGRSWRSAIPDHIYLFSKKTLRRMLVETGFDIARLISWGGIPAGRRPDFIKRPADRLAKMLNIGDVMLFHCTPNGRKGECDD